MNTVQEALTLEFTNAKIMQYAHSKIYFVAGYGNKKATARP